MDASPLTVDVVSDVMCPWCYIGKRRLEGALRLASDVPVAVRWRPFQLDPTLPPEGKDRRAYLDEKFGGAERARAIYEQVAAAGAQENIPFAFDRIARAPNTLEAHALIALGAAVGLQDEIVERLFSAYFVAGRDLTERETLVAIAREAGLQEERVSDYLGDERVRAAVASDVASARRAGISGVPVFVLDGRYALVGAQPAETLAAALRAVANERAARDGARTG